MQIELVMQLMTCIGKLLLDFARRLLHCAFQMQAAKDQSGFLSKFLRGIHVVLDVLYPAVFSMNFCRQNCFGMGENSPNQAFAACHTDLQLSNDMKTASSDPVNNQIHNGLT